MLMLVLVLILVMMLVLMLTLMLTMAHAIMALSLGESCPPRGDSYYSYDCRVWRLSLGVTRGLLCSG